MKKTMLINTVEGHECRIAIVGDGRLEELYTERSSHISQVGNIYKVKVTNIEPSIQAAFVDYGETKNGFLHISDLHPRYFPKSKDQTEKVGRRTAHRSRPPIQDCLRRGQELLVQMTKEGIGTKGPTMTAYLSIPGRLMVMMPDMEHAGISRKIEDPDARSKIRGMLNEIKMPENMGVIVRTAGIGRTKRDLQRDMSYLQRVWKEVDAQAGRKKAPSCICQESDLVLRTLRDIYDTDFERIVCDNADATIRVRQFLDLAVPRSKGCKVEYYEGGKGMFEYFGVEEEIGKIHARKVDLRGGGSIVIDQTEALVAIDVNSGGYRGDRDAETNALKLNSIAAEEITRQLRLRDMGGVIVIDFIDMRDEKNRRALERRVKELMKDDRGKHKILRVSQFGLIQMTRQRLRPSLRQSEFARCPHCGGTGLVMSEESLVLQIIRRLGVIRQNDDVATVDVAVSPMVAHDLLNEHRETIAEMERTTAKRVIISADNDCGANEFRITCRNPRGNEVHWDTKASRKKNKVEVSFTDVARLAKAAGGVSADERDDETAKPEVVPSALERPEMYEELDPDETTDTAAPKKKRRRRGRRGGKKLQTPEQTDGAPVEQTEGAGEQEPPTEEATSEQSETPARQEEDSNGEAKKKRRRRGRRGGRRRKKNTDANGEPVAAPEERQEASAPSAEEEREESAPKKKVKRVRRVRKVAKKTDAPAAVEEAPAEATQEPAPVKTIKRVRKPAKKAPAPASKAPAKPAAGTQRVFELARELGVSSKEIVEKSKAEGLDVKSHMATVQKSLVKRISGWFKK